MTKKVKYDKKKKKIEKQNKQDRKMTYRLVW